MMENIENVYLKNPPANYYLHKSDFLTGSNVKLKIKKKDLIFFDEPLRKWLVEQRNIRLAREVDDFSNLLMLSSHTVKASDGENKYSTKLAKYAIIGAAIDICEQEIESGDGISMTKLLSYCVGGENFEKTKQKILSTCFNIDDKDVKIILKKNSNSYPETLFFIHTGFRFYTDLLIRSLEAKHERIARKNMSLQRLCEKFYVDATSIFMLIRSEEHPLCSFAKQDIQLQSKHTVWDFSNSYIKDMTFFRVKEKRLIRLFYNKEMVHFQNSINHSQAYEELQDQVFDANSTPTAAIVIAKSQDKPAVDKQFDKTESTNVSASQGVSIDTIERNADAGAKQSISAEAGTEVKSLEVDAQKHSDAQIHSDDGAIEDIFQQDTTENGGSDSESDKLNQKAKDAWAFFD